MATKENEVFGKFNSGGISSKIKFIDYLNENTKIRIDNGQNILFVYLIFLIRFFKNINKIFKDLNKQKFMKKKILITGVAGFIGFALAEKLIKITT